VGEVWVGEVDEGHDSDQSEAFSIEQQCRRHTISKGANERNIETIICGTICDRKQQASAFGDSRQAINQSPTSLQCRARIEIDYNPIV
jgi:hypothetical protein